MENDFFTFCELSLSDSIRTSCILTMIYIVPMRISQHFICIYFYTACIRACFSCVLRLTYRGQFYDIYTWVLLKRMFF